MSNPRNSALTVQARFLSDVNTYQVALASRRDYYGQPVQKYLVGGREMVGDGSWVEVTSLEEVKVCIQVQDQPAFYRHKETGQTITPEFYQSSRNNYSLTAFGRDISEDDDDDVKVVEDKQAYDELKALDRDWEFVRATSKDEFVTPVFETLPGRLRSGSPFVVSTRTTSGQAFQWEYDQASASMHFVAECFASLGVTREEKELRSTAPGNTWSNSTHSHLRYVTAFGKYIFSDHDRDFIKSPRYYQGSLEDMLERERQDKDYIERVLRMAWQAANGGRKANATELAVLIADLKATRNDISRIKATSKTWGEYRGALTRLDARIKALEDVAFAELEAK